LWRSGLGGIRTTTTFSWSSARNWILHSAAGSELLAEREDPFEFGADVEREGLAASRINLDWLAPGFLDLVVGRADDEDVLVVEVVGRARVVEAPGDDRAVVNEFSKKK
jgi:hypothetical protein